MGCLLKRCMTQAPSHKTSTGQARAKLAPRMLASRMVRAEPGKVTAGDLLNESRNVDVGWAGGGGGSVKAVETLDWLRYRRLPVEGRVQIAETRGGLRMAGGLLQKRWLATMRAVPFLCVAGRSGVEIIIMHYPRVKIRISPYHH